MSLTDIQSEITNLTELDYQELRRWLIGPERRRRQEERGKAELVLEEREAGLRDAPAAAVPEDQADDLAAYSAWRDPGVIHDRMYGLGDRVCHTGRLWESTTPGLNHWEPGAPGVWDNVWRDITDTVARDEPDEPPVETPEPETERPAEGTEPDTPEEEPTPSSPTVPEWRAGLAVVPGEQVTYDGTAYTVVQGHTTQAGWAPPSVPALFAVG